MDRPSISVIKPVYNCDKYLKDSIDSILNQSFTDFEFITINNDSTYRTVRFLLSCLADKKYGIYFNVLREESKVIKVEKIAYCIKLAEKCRFKV